MSDARFAAAVVSQSDRAGYRWRCRAVVGERLQGFIYELPSGQRLSPFQFQIGNEQLLIVLEGGPILRSGDGERRLYEGEIVFFPQGFDGAHQIRNDSSETARVLVVSTRRVPSLSVLPDSGKVEVHITHHESMVFREATAVDYWEDE